MNLRNKILITLFALGTIFWSCDSIIYDNLDDCTQGVYVSFYSMTPCSVDSSFIGNTSSITVFAFDENEKLVETVKENDVNLSRNFEVFVPVSNGRYTFVAWAGVDDNFDLSSLNPGVTTKKDVMLTLKSVSSVANSLDNTKLWQGEQSVPILIEDPKEYGSVFKHTAINLREITNRVKVIVEFEDGVQGVTPVDLNVAVSSANSVYRINGTMPIGTPQIAYPLLNTQYAAKSVTWDYTMLDLQTGYLNNLNITYPAKGHVVFNGDLIAIILLYEMRSGINLVCENDFTVKIVLKDYCSTCTSTNFTCAIYVNDWIIHSYSTQL